MPAARLKAEQTERHLRGMCHWLGSLRPPQKSDLHDHSDKDVTSVMMTAAKVHFISEPLTVCLAWCCSPQRDCRPVLLSQFHSCISPKWATELWTWHFHLDRPRRDRQALRRATGGAGDGAG